MSSTRVKHAPAPSSIDSMVQEESFGAYKKCFTTRTATWEVCILRRQLCLSERYNNTCAQNREGLWKDTNYFQSRESWWAEGSDLRSKWKVSSFYIYITGFGIYWPEQAEVKSITCRKQQCKLVQGQNPWELGRKKGNGNRYMRLDGYLQCCTVQGI